MRKSSSRRHGLSGAVTTQARSVREASCKAQLDAELRPVSGLLGEDRVPLLREGCHGAAS